MDSGGDKAKKQHKKKKSGVKARKKKDKAGKVERHNPKAHTFSGGARSVHKRVLFTLEKQSKKEHAPKVDKNPEVPPPFIVVVQGPPGVGKTTLIHSLVKHFARQRLLQMRGPITLVSGRQRRLTIVECPQDMSAMLDLAKVADLVLLLIDASFGFELETFEFINILQVHGFPRVIGVLTHLDSFKENKQLRKVKKTMKQRFWAEIYDGAKLFYLSGLQYGRYHRLEIQNLARFISVQKHPVLSWRQTHPYMLALRWEDHTDPTAPEGAPRTLDLYGYVCGGRLREGSEVHLAGVGDFHISSMKRLPDPCPPPADVEARRQKAGGKANDKPKRKNALRTLAERHRIVYAPGSDIGSITVDSEAMYIHVPEQEVGFTQREGEEAAGDDDLPEAVRLVRALQGETGALDRAAASRPSLRLTGSTTLRLQPQGEGGGTSGAGAPPAERLRRLAPAGNSTVPARRAGRKGVGSNGDEADGDNEREEDDHDEEDEEEDEEDVDEEPEDLAAGKEGSEARGLSVLERARQRFSRPPRLEEMIYGGASGVEVGGAVSSTAPAPAESRGKQGEIKPTDHATVPLFEDDEDDEGRAQGQLNGQGHAAERELGRRQAAQELLGNLGDLDVLDTVRMPSLPGTIIALDEEQKEALKARKFITGGWSSAEEDEHGSGDEGGEGGEDGGKRKEKPTEGAAEAEGEGKDQADVAAGLPDADAFGDSASISTFVRVRLEDVPAACVAEMRQERPIVLGGLTPGESRLGQVQVRVKRHRWHPKLLKTGEALLLSVGWRRFQTVPTFSIEDRGEKRMRYLKYTLEHAHCTMTTYSPMVPPNAGVLAFRSWQKVNHFRVCATGVVLESAPNFEVVKKLKLVGEPYKIFRNTAFVRNMFNSDLEVNKYLHAKIQTVSGIRGEIKKAEGTRGNFRASFEDRILMSDLVVCKCWTAVEPKKFYHPVVDIDAWRPARLVGELRAAAGVPVPDNKDSHYGKAVVRAERKFNPLKVPKTLEVSLPFKSKRKLEPKKRQNPIRQKTAIVSSERERAINSLLSRLHAVRKEKRRIRQAASEEKKVLKEKRDKFIQDKRDANAVEARKKRYIKQGKQEVQRRKAMHLE